MKFYQLAEKKDGVMTYNKEKLNHLIENLFDGRYLVSFQRINPKTTVKEYRACYFAKVDALAAEIGDTRYGVHEQVKELVLAKMADEVPELFTKQIVSTRYLSLEGWGNFLERLDLWSFIEFGVILE